MNIVAIGGGELTSRETLPIDRLVVEMTGKFSPKALFIPTASGDAKDYCDGFAEIYGKLLGCHTESLLLLSRDKDSAGIREKILSADLIYVGGGYTLRMMKIWRKLGVDTLLESAYKQGTVLAGISAGAICWHRWGHSNSRSYASQDDWRYVRVKGLGLCPGIFCPHLGEEQRHKSFIDMVRRHGGLGIACDNNAAVHYSAGYPPRVLCADSRATVRLYRRDADEVRSQVFSSGQALDIPG